MSKFRVGDKVRVVCEDPIYEWGFVSRGDVGVVNKVNSRDLLVNFPVQENWRGLERELQLVEAGPWAKGLPVDELRLKDAPEGVTHAVYFGDWHWRRFDKGMVYMWCVDIWKPAHMSEDVWFAEFGEKCIELAPLVPKQQPAPVPEKLEQKKGALKKPVGWW